MKEKFIEIMVGNYVMYKIIIYNEEAKITYFGYPNTIKSAKNKDSSLIEINFSGITGQIHKRSDLGFMLNNVPTEINYPTPNQQIFLHMNDSPIAIYVDSIIKMCDGVAMQIMYSEGIIQIRFSLQEAGTGCFWVDGYVTTYIIPIDEKFN